MTFEVRTMQDNEAPIVAGMVLLAFTFSLIAGLAMYLLIK